MCDKTDMFPLFFIVFLERMAVVAVSKPTRDNRGAKPENWGPQPVHHGLYTKSGGTGGGMRWTPKNGTPLGRPMRKRRPYIAEFTKEVI